jgi:hypothetical protein
MHFLLTGYSILIYQNIQIAIKWSLWPTFRVQQITCDQNGVLRSSLCVSAEVSPSLTSSNLISHSHSTSPDVVSLSPLCSEYHHPNYLDFLRKRPNVSPRNEHSSYYDLTFEIYRIFLSTRVLSSGI